MDSVYNPAIDALKKRLEETERKAAEIRNAINMLCEEAGIPAAYSQSSTGAQDRSSPIPSQIGNDTFYGKKQQTAIREYLGMRKAQGLGPATPREVYDALVAGGYKFEAKNAETALIGIRALLRKRYLTFHKLPNGTYGLTSWYPNIKVGKSTDNNSADPQDDEESADE